MKYYTLLFVLFIALSCSKKEDDTIPQNDIPSQNDDNQDNTDGDGQDDDTPGDDQDNTTSLIDNFDGTGALIDYTTNNASALPNVSRASGRYRAALTDNTDNKTLHYNQDQGRLDAKLVTFPFEFIARNIGIGTIADSQIAPTSDNNPYNFCGVQVHVEDFNSINSSHVVVGHRGSTGFTIEGKNTLNGDSSVNDIGENTVPEGRADIRIVGNNDKTLTVYWQRPNLTGNSSSDDWTLYNDNGLLPGTAPTYGDNVYVGLITYAFYSTGVPFVGTCDSIEIKK
ncbi:hypothetical protein [Flavivirga eckloniae]|uniref:Uncharacterized protein n=1 Tax=Flavivirga eckloniae TaxID=1803846 RepID=A0A2K9PL46_9FLAO|nr:hypothetical protein [Flavivirga eckloniae]AUP77791.1 hypothetical protein C1H87_03290 [Flavivirga eckloniae]